MSSTSATSGVYFLANDRVLNWAIAFFESLRAHEPDIRLVMIPFNDRIEKIAAMQSRYNFEVFDHPSLSALDTIGEGFFPDWEIWQRTFRKFAVFWGPLERFIFSDVDIVFLEGVKQFADAYDRSQLDLLYSDEDIRQVYEQPNLREQMIKLNGARGFNTGFWAARRDLFTLERVAQLAEEAKPVAREFNQGTYEQPFINYCFDMTRRRYGQFAQVMPGLTGTSLASLRGVRKDTQGIYHITDRDSPEAGKRIAFLHWAGTPATPVMPYRSIFMRYRMKSEPRWRRVWMAVKGMPRAVAWRIIRFGRSAGLISRTYKRVMPKRVQQRVSEKLSRK